MVFKLSKRVKAVCSQWVHQQRCKGLQSPSVAQHLMQKQSMIMILRELLVEHCMVLSEHFQVLTEHGDPDPGFERLSRQALAGKGWCCYWSIGSRPLSTAMPLAITKAQMVRSKTQWEVGRLFRFWALLSMGFRGFKVHASVRGFGNDH
jgi:hypothetical protein